MFFNFPETTRTDETSRKPYPLPEILDADLAPLALDLALWGTPNPGQLLWPTPPPPENFRSAVRLLQRLGAVDGTGRATVHGRELARLPVHPRLGNMLLAAREHGLASTAAHLAALLSKPATRHADLRDALTALYLYCKQNEITDIDLAKNTELQFLFVSENCLKFLNLRNTVKLEKV